MFVRDKNIFMINGDIFSNLNFGNILNSHIKRNNDITICARIHQYKLPFGLITTKSKNLLLNEKKIYCSTILMNDKIDEGKILLIKNYNLPKNIKEIDKDFDDLIRSKNLVFLLKNFNLKKKVKLLKHNYKPYYVIHPVLRSAVFKRYEKNF
jgi:NDP-sugar pyrophosphorylase family protein